MRELIIKRSEWLHTKEDLRKQSFLHRQTDGKKCCLGHYAVACGVPIQQIAEVPSFYPGPQDGHKAFKGILPDEMQWLLEGERTDNSQDANTLMADNDSLFIIDKEKEVRIARTFAKHDVKVTFVD